MNNSDWNIWINLTFNIQSSHKNFDLISENENFITECEGNVSEIRFSENKLPRIIGEFRLSVWNIALGTLLNADFPKLFMDYILDDTYSEFISLIHNKQFKINEYNKIIFIHSFVLIEKYRKKGITEEFIEMIFREYYDKKFAIIFLVKPLQNNANEYDTFSKYKSIKCKEYFYENESYYIPAIEYYSLNNLSLKTDNELNEYKLFSIAINCGFKRIGESHLFIFSPENTINRMKHKEEKLKISNFE